MPGGEHRCTRPSGLPAQKGGERVIVDQESQRRARLLLIRQLRIPEPAPGRLPIRPAEELLAEPIDSTWDKEHGVAEIDPTHGPAAIQTPTMPSLRRQRHLAALAHFDFTGLRHRHLHNALTVIAL